jgi:hypothetical protein
MDAGTAALALPTSPVGRHGLPDLQALHPSLWLGHQLGRAFEQAVPTGSGCD